MKKVLIVEDNPDLRQILSMQIEFMGFRTVVAKDGEAGVELASREKPLLILMDIMMPTMDGREAVRVIRSNPETRTIPILAATAFSRDMDLKTVLDAGFDDYLLKPFTIKELQTKVQTLVANSEKTGL